MLTLANLKATRISKGFTPGLLADVTSIEPIRYRSLEMHSREQAEPWFHEAAMLSRALCVQGINPLIGHEAIADLGLGSALPVEVDMFRSGIRISLTTACRVATAFGLTDPLHLVEVPPALMSEIWSVVSTGERSPALGDCPWCAQPDGQHLTTCLPNNLLSPRAADQAPNVTMPIPPRSRGKGKLPSGPGKGLKAFRTSQGLTQVEMAAKCGMTNANYYARIERMDDPLSVDRAAMLANAFGVDRNLFYMAPAEEVAQA